MRTADYVARLHAVVDGLTAPLVDRHRARLKCGRGCAACCADGLTVSEAEADLLRERHGALLEEGEPHAEGGCAMLGAEGECRVYAERPYVCRTQGLPLRWGEGGVEKRDVCPLNAEGEPIEALPADACWTIGPVEQRIAAVNGDRGRVALRDLFRRPPRQRR